jgi:hypothetical protein
MLWGRDVHLHSAVKFSQALEEEVFCSVNLCHVRATCLVSVVLEEREALEALNEVVIWYCTIVWN